MKKMINDILPNEILYQVNNSFSSFGLTVKIFMWLRRAELHSCCCVCTGWNHLISQCKLLNEKKSNLDLYDPVCLECRFGIPNGKLIGICIMSGKIIIPDSNGEIFSVFDTLGQFVNCLYPLDKEGKVYKPGGVSVLSKNNLVIADCENARIHILDQDYNLVSSISLGTFNAYTLCCNSQGFIIAATLQYRVIILNRDGHIIKIFGPRGKDSNEFGAIGGICCNSRDEILVADHDNHRIQMFGKDGEFIRTFGLLQSNTGTSWYPNGISVDWQDNIIVAEAWNGRVCIFTPEGLLIQQFYFYGASDVCLSREKLIISSYHSGLIGIFTNRTPLSITRICA